MPEMTEREQLNMEEQGLSSLQIAYLSCWRWEMRRRGHAGNPLSTPDALRNRTISGSTAVTL